jgi:SAM-dependent methyltransferase
MNRRRYDDVVRFVASILFGTSFRQIHSLIESLKDLGCANLTAIFTTVVFFAVFFRNVHGLIAHDIWAENSQYEPIFEQNPRHIVLHFIFGLAGAILSPYLFIYLLTSGLADKSVIASPSWITFFLFLPMLVYVFWNWFWLWKLSRHPIQYPGAERPRSNSSLIFVQPLSDFREWVLRKSKRSRMPNEKLSLASHEEEFHAYDEILDFTILWVVIDLVWISVGCIWLLFQSGSVSDLCIMYSVIAVTVLAFDYCSHICYYFPRPSPPPYHRDTHMTNNFYEFGELWEHVLPDGMRFCHWGGKAFSNHLVKMLEVKPEDRVLELCCGQGGTLGLLRDFRQIAGIDISQQKIDSAEIHLAGKSADLRVGDISEGLPFPDETFTKLFSQDGDAWMHPAKHVIMSEISRVTARGGRFIFQTYACSSAMPAHALIKTAKFLHGLGYVNVDVPQLEEIPKMFQLAGFRTESIVLLHQMYAQDNARMLKRFEENQGAMVNKFGRTAVENLGKWLEWEKKLFLEGWWSGILVTAKKD